MAELIYLVLHVDDTPYGRKVTKDDIFMWHCFPKRNANGTYTYLGKTMQNLPDDYYVINGQRLSIKKYTTGRGWSVVGYSDMIYKSAELVNLNPYNSDGFVDKWEVTNGVAGINSKARHCVISGGHTKDGRKSGIFEPEEIFTPEQIITLIDYIKMMKEVFPNIIIKGHHEFDKSKTCPNFDVQKFLKKHNLL